MEGDFGQTFSPNLLLAQTVFGGGANSPLPPDNPDPNDGNNKRPDDATTTEEADSGGGRRRPRRPASNEALEGLFWREVPQDLWDRIVQKRGACFQLVVCCVRGVDGWMDGWMD
jgi:hypothetical protein